MIDYQNSIQSEPAPSLKMSITPEPSGDEEEALVAAITVYLVMRSPIVGTIASPPVASRWVEVGRKAAVRGLANGPKMGWGRGREF